MKKLRELREQLAALTSEERNQLERLKAEGRGLEGNEKTTYETRARKIEALETEIDGAQCLNDGLNRHEERDARLSRLTSKPERSSGDDGGRLVLRPGEVRMLSKSERVPRIA